MNIQALLLAAASMTARATAEFTVSAGTTEATTSSTEHVSFAKQWTLNTANSADTISSIDLDLVGSVYVSYASGLPSGVLGYVNVSGDSQTVVDAVTVSNDDSNDTDNNDDTNDTDGELNVRFGNSTSTATTPSGYLLTEIILASSGIVTDVKSQRSAQVVVEDGVLATSSTTAELQVEVSGSSAVYVSAASTAVSVRQLQLEAAGSATLQLNVESVSVTDDVNLEAQGSAGISLLASSVEAAQLELDAQSTGTICISAAQVTATNYQGQDASRISMPNASSKYDSTGSFACDESSVPAREPACVSSACAGWSSSGATEGTVGSGASTTTTVTSAPATVTTTDGDDNDTGGSSTAEIAGVVAAMIGVVVAGWRLYSKGWGFECKRNMCSSKYPITGCRR